MEWVKPSKCGESSHCLEIGTAVGMVFLQNSSTPVGEAREGVVSLTPQELLMFLEAAKAGEYDGYAITL